MKHMSNNEFWKDLDTKIARLEKRRGTRVSNYVRVVELKKIRSNLHSKLDVFVREHNHEKVELHRRLVRSKRIILQMGRAFRELGVDYLLKQYKIDNLPKKFKKIFPAEVKEAEE